MKGIYLFGSYALGLENADSDIDIAFFTPYPHSLTSKERFDLAAELGFQLKMDVDLISIRDSNTDLAFEIISKGIRIYCSDVYACDFYEMIAISSYQKLEEERAPLIEAFKKRGSIYG